LNKKIGVKKQQFDVKKSKHLVQKKQNLGVKKANNWYKQKFGVKMRAKGRPYES